MALQAARSRMEPTDPATITLPAGGKWITGVRKAAKARLVAMGLPGRRDEYWKYTRPDALIAPEPARAPLLTTDEKPVFDQVDRLKLVFVDGKLDLAASDPLAMAEIEIETLPNGAKRDLHWAQGMFGALEARGQNPVPRPLAALNTTLAEEGLLIRVTGVAPRPICLHYVRENPDADAMVRHLIRLEPGASLTLLENGPAAARLNAVTEVDIADGAAFHHIRTQGRDHARQAATHLFASLGKGSEFKSFTLTVNGILTRNECVIDLTGDDASATVSGASVGDGDFHQDDTVFVTHQGANCASRQVFKKVLRNGATGVFQGKILVEPTAQKTDGYQISQGLLLDEDSQFLAKPELEIYADDVACSHGSTVGAIDETALFYLTSRGIPRNLAQDMLVLAFLAEALGEIGDAGIRADIQARLEGWIERHRA